MKSIMRRIIITILLIGMILSTTEVQAKPLTSDSRWKSPKVEWQPIKKCTWSKKQQRKIQKICNKYGISFEMCIAQAYYESEWGRNYDDTDGGKAYGAWQIHPYEWLSELTRWGYEPNDMWDLYDACDVYCRIMKAYFKENDDMEWALMAWNCGGYRAKQLLKQGYVNNYTKKIINDTAKYEKRLEHGKE